MRGLLMLFAILSVGPSVFAQEEEPDYYLGIRLGYIELEDVDEDGSVNMGLTFGRHLNRYFTQAER